MAMSNPFSRRPASTESAAWRNQQEAEAAAEKRREAAESRRESERRWYAHLPIIAIATLATAVVAVTALLVLASQYLSPATPPAASAPPSVPERVPPASAPASAVAISLRQHELFGYDSAELRGPPAQLETCLRPTLTRIRIVGHADCIGSDAYNQRLSQRRAEAVRDYLVARGVRLALVAAEGQGARLARAEPDCAGPMRATPTIVARLERFRRVDVHCEFGAPAV